MMLKNYLKIALRNLRRNPGYTGLNVGGLALGLACCLLIVLYVRDELSFDRFHENANRTYRVIQMDRDPSSENVSVTTAVPLAPVLTDTYPEVQHATRLLKYWFTPLVSRGNQGYHEKNLLFADAAFFDVFSFELRRGNPQMVLVEPFSIVLTEMAARKYFGDDDPIGQTLVMNAAHTYTVTGVLADPPRNSHFHFDMLASIDGLSDVIDWDGVLENWGLQAFHTYIVLPDGYDPHHLEAKLTDVVEAHYGEETQLRYALQPLTDVHLHSHYGGEIEANSDIRYVWILSGIAFVILLLACINYTNLATARFARRTKEVGVRKAMGAQRRQLMLQFLGESLLFAFLAMLGALLLLEALLPSFNQVTGRALVMHYLDKPEVLATLFGVAAFAGLAAGGYPAFYLSSFRPDAMLKSSATGRRRAPLRTTLIVFQYAMAVVLLASTGVVYRQLDYIQNKKLGFSKDHLIVLPVRDEQVQGRPDAAKAAFAALPEVSSVANSTSVPGAPTPSTSDFRPEGYTSDEPFRIMLAWIDTDYVETMGMTVAAGRDFDPAFPSDSSDAVLLNEEAVRQIGWASPAEAVGKRVDFWGQHREIIGVVNDFHIESLREPLKPLVFIPNLSETQGLIVRLRTDNLAASLAHLEAIWKQLSTAQPFTYTFLDQDLAQLYIAEQRWGVLIGWAAGLALLIACLGLFGLAAFAAEQRRKEIGVRKVLGAGVGSLALLLSKDFARLVLIAFVVGAPLAYLAMRQWLADFAYHAELGPGLFVLAGGLALAIALLTVSYHAVRAALADPVKSLRYE